MCKGCKDNCRTCDEPVIERNTTTHQIISETEDFSLRMVMPICAIACTILILILMFIGGD